jgi:diguanylate cyclase (GGDEF)-like protein
MADPTPSRRGSTARDVALDLCIIGTSSMLVVAAERAAPSTYVLALLFVIPIAIAGLRRSRAGLMLTVFTSAIAATPYTWPLPIAAVIAIGVRLALFSAAATAAWHLRTELEGLTFCAYHDALTGLRNRRGLELAAAAEIARARRYGRPLTIAYLDLDDFKHVNDTLGHAAGDRLLELVADGLRQVRVCDVAARVGGDEFVLLMPETSEAESEAALDRVRAAIARGAAAADTTVEFTCGMLRFERPPEALGDMLRAVDRMLYAGKQARKSSVRAATVAALSTSTTRLRRSALTEALPTRRLALVE